MGYVILQGGNIVGTGVYTDADEIKDIEANGIQLMTYKAYADTKKAKQEV